MHKVGVFVLRNLAIVLVLFFYFWVATDGRYNFVEGDRTISNNYYHLLTDSIVSGHLYLPTQHALHDTAFYKGKCYMYHGITPIAVLYLPYRLITKTMLPHSLAIFIFSCGTFLFSVLILFYVQKRHFVKTPEWMLLVSITVLGFSNITGGLMRTKGMYEVAIGSGICFLIGSIYFLTKSVASEKLRILNLALGSLLLGFSIGSRPQVILSTVLILVILVRFLCAKVNTTSFLYLFLAGILPLFVTLFFLGLYNYLRFDNPFELGFKHYRSYLCLPDPNWLNELKIILFNFYLLFFHSPLINADFPFVHLRYKQLPFFMSTDPFFGSGGAIAGILVVFPFVLMPIIYFITLFFVKNKLTKPLPQFLLCLIYIPFLINLFFLLIIRGTEMRYRADIMTLLLLVVSFLWFYFDSLLHNSPLIRTLLSIFSVIFAVISILCGIAFSIEATETRLAFQNPHEFEKISSYFSWLIPIINLLLGGAQ